MEYIERYLGRIPQIDFNKVLESLKVRLDRAKKSYTEILYRHQIRSSLNDQYNCELPESKIDCKGILVSLETNDFVALTNGLNDIYISEYGISLDPNESKSMAIQLLLNEQSADLLSGDTPKSLISNDYFTIGDNTYYLKILPYGVKK